MLARHIGSATAVPRLAANAPVRREAGLSVLSFPDDAPPVRTMQLAIKIARDVTGHVPATARRFETGMRHYVFEVGFASRQPVVVRIGAESALMEMAGLTLTHKPSNRLRSAAPNLVGSKARHPISQADSSALPCRS